jgi:hypothetical protein
MADRLSLKYFGDYRMRLTFINFLLFTLLGMYPVFGQSVDSLSSFSKENIYPEEQLLPLRNSFGICATATIGDMSVLQRPLLMYSLFYGYQYSDVINIEGSIHFLSVNEFGTYIAPNFFPAGTPIPWNVSQGILSLHSLSGDVSVLFSPFPMIKGWSGLRGGVGISARSAGMFGSNMSFDLQNPKVYNFNLRYSVQTAFGANARIEYLVPLDKTVDIGFRFYGQAFLPPIAITGDSIPIGAWYPPSLPAPKEGLNRIAIGALGFGMFLRMSF